MSGFAPWTSSSSGTTSPESSLSSSDRFGSHAVALSLRATRSLRLDASGGSPANRFPDRVDMALLGPRLADRETQREPPVVLGVSEEEPAGRVHGLEDPFVRFVAADVAEADEIQRRGRGQLEARCSFDPLAERLRERDVTPD